MMNLKVGINAYSLSADIFVGISIRADLCIVGCSVYMLYSDTILQNRKEPKCQEKIHIQLKEHR